MRECLGEPATVANGSSSSSSGSSAYDAAFDCWNQLSHCVNTVEGGQVGVVVVVGACVEALVGVWGVGGDERGVCV